MATIGGWMSFAFSFTNICFPFLFIYLFIKQIKRDIRVFT